MLSHETDKVLRTLFYVCLTKYQNMHIRNLFFLFLTALFFSSCAVRPKGGFNSEVMLPAVDYGNPDNWAALPDRVDPADRTPDPSLPDRQAEAEADVFFLHPTTYTGKKGHRYWNGPIDDKSLNKRTDELPILYQATIFNGAGRIYAPRYRQAHLHSYYTKNRKDEARQALELAYEDVRAAFKYYLEHYNQGRPIIIAAHSQGAGHGGRLVKEFFDGKPLQEKLIVAYLVGMPIENGVFSNIPPCAAPEETGCFCTWRSYKKGHFPKKFPWGDQIAVTNPLLWTTTEEYASKTLNEGGVLNNFTRIFPRLADAQVHKGLLWVSKPKFPGSFLLWSRNYHAGDLNLYYLNVRRNVEERTRAFLGSRSGQSQ
jgi:hypothetical protein